MGNDNIDPEVFARQRCWLDERGAPTKEGLEMLRALSDQQGTRSVFRPF
jgi:hypothetical protein